MNDESLADSGHTTPFLIREGWSALRRSGRSALLATVMTAIAIFAAGLLVSTATGLERLARRFASQSRLVIYLAPGAEESDRSAIEGAVAASRLAREVVRVSPEEARARLARMYTSLSSATQAADPAAFPASIEVDFAEGVKSAARTALAEKLATLPAVDEIQYDRDWIDRLSRLARGIRWIGAGLLLLLGTGAALISGAAMRMSLFEAQDEVRVLRLIGATEPVIRGPYLVAGAAVGLAGSLVAIVALFLTTSVASRLAAHALPLLPDDVVARPGWLDSLLLLVLGTAAAAAGSWSASREARGMR